MSTKRYSSRGQVLIIFVFAIIGLIGMAGLAIDGGNLYAERRKAQNAADAAALQAAVLRNNLEKSGANASECENMPLITPVGGYSGCAGNVILAAHDLAKTNGYKDINVDVVSPPIDGPYGPSGTCTSTNNCRRQDYIEVIIHSQIDTYFARVLGIGTLNNTVRAVAKARYVPEHSLYGGQSLVVLRPTSSACVGEFTLGGSGKVELIGGGIFVNSDNSSCAFKETSNCVEVILTPASGSTVIPGVQVYGGTNQFFSSCANHPTLTKPTDPWPWTPESPLFSPGEEPAECSQIPQVEKVIGGISHYYPGHYAMLPPDKNVVLENGVYCVDNVIKTTNPTKFSNDKGNSGVGGVFLYIRPGGSFDFQGGIVDLNAPTSGRYKGYLIYVDPGNFTGVPKNCVINGNSNTTFTGVIYAPYCDVQINGGSGPTGITAQIIGYTLSLNGDSYLKFIYDEAKMPKVPEVNKTGLYH